MEEGSGDRAVWMDVVETDACHFAAIAFDKRLARFAVSRLDGYPTRTRSVTVVEFRNLHVHVTRRRSRRLQSYISTSRTRPPPAGG